MIQRNKWNEGMAPAGHTHALPAKLSLRYLAKQPNGLMRSWFIWDASRKQWVSNLNGGFRRFKSQAAAEMAARKLNAA